MTHARPLALAALLLAPLALGGCGGETARAIGLTRDAPDEFTVTTRAPLSMPPMLGQLPPPRPGAARPQELAAREQAELALAPAAALTGGAPRPQGATAGEAALLARSGPGAPANIRNQVDQEALRIERADRGLVDRVIFWREPPQPGIPVDPTREAQRLRENAALGRSASDGETPIIQPQRRGIFDQLRFW
ncbi:MAG: DUF3035 domain-containing protein [Rubritepida sp.]|jgi:hypothetical protein|nr:DUF3035 domain-containing protein [Rubritepida sp.]MCU0944281.1 DUF3035 domain-containing protein [Rubritepida sp.]